MRPNQEKKDERTVFPSILSRITEVVDGFTVTVWPRLGPALIEATLLTDEPVRTIEEARTIAARLAEQHAIRVTGEIISMHNLAARKERRH